MLSSRPFKCIASVWSAIFLGLPADFFRSMFVTQWWQRLWQKTGDSGCTAKDLVKLDSLWHWRTVSLCWLSGQWTIEILDKHFLAFFYLTVSSGFLSKPSAYSVLNNKQAAHIFWPAKGRQGWRKKDPRSAIRTARKRPCFFHRWESWTAQYKFSFKSSLSSALVPACGPSFGKTTASAEELTLKRLRQQGWLQ